MTSLRFAKGLSHRVYPLALALVIVSMTPAAIAQQAAAAEQQSAQAATGPDAEVQAAVVAAITASPVLNVQPIAAQTANGQVTLTGSVDDAASKELAEMLVSKVSGVRSVVNSLEIVSIGAPPVGSTSEGAATGAQPYPQQAPQADGSGQDQAGNPSASQPTPPYTQAPDAQGQYPPDNRYPDRRYPDSRGAPQGQYPASQYPDDRAAQIGPVQIPQGTLLVVRLNEFLDSRKTAQGATFEATAARDIYAGGVLAIPRGAVVQGQVVEIRSVKGSLGGNSSISLQLNSLILEGRNYSLGTDVWISNGPGKGAYSVGNTITGASIGAVIGGFAGGGAGAAVGATLGGATGAAASSASSGPRVVLPPETTLSFHLSNAITVQPVSYREAQRLASSSRQDGGPYPGRRPMYAPAGMYGYPYAYPYAYVYAPGYYPYRYGYRRYRGYRGW